MPLSLLGDREAETYFQTLSECTPSQDNDESTLEQVRRGTQAMIQLMRMGYVREACAAMPQRLGTHLLTSVQGRPALAGYLARLSPEAWADFCGATEGFSDLAPLTRFVQRVRALALAAAPAQRESLITGLCTGVATHRNLPLDPLKIKAVSLEGTVAPPKDSAGLQAFFSLHSMAGAPPAQPAPGPQSHADAVIALVNGAASSSWGAHYALPRGLRRLLKHEAPAFPANTFHNVTTQSLTLRVHADGHKHTLRVPAGERVALPTSNVTKLHLRHAELTLNPYVADGRLTLRPENQARPLPLLGDEVPGAMTYGAPLPIPPLVHTIWLGGPLPEAYQPRVASFRKHNPDHTSVLWTDLSAQQFAKDAGLQLTAAFCRQNGVALMSVERHLLPWLHQEGVAELYREQLHHRQYAGASDILRTVLLKHLGGTYADADRACLQPLHGLRTKELVIAVENDGLTPCLNDFLMARPSHPLFDVLLDTFKSRSTSDSARPVRALFSREDEAVIQMTGPGALRRAYFVWAAAALGPNALPTTSLSTRGREPPQDTVGRLLPAHLDQGNSLQTVCNRSSDVLWIDQHRTPQRWLADASESASARETRLVSNLLDDVRLFGDVDLAHHAMLQRDPMLLQRLLSRLTEILAAHTSSAPAARSLQRPGKEALAGR